MTRVDLITGFLGSGKTTFIKEYATYLARQGLKTAIIVNDYGAINVDRMLLGDTLSDSCHLEMVIGGDADCTRRRLKTKLITVAMAKYDHVIVEPSGIFDVDEFYDLLYEEPLDRWYEMGSVITIIEDGISSELSGEAEYIFTSQVAKAGTVIVSKLRKSADEASGNLSDNLACNLSDNLKNNLTYINSCLEKYKCNRRFDKLYLWRLGEITDSDFEAIRKSGYHSGDMPRYLTAGTPGEHKPYGGDTFDSGFFFHVKVPVCELENTIRQIFEDPETGDIIRLKGFIKKDADTWLEINATKSEINIRPIAMGQELFIVIGEGLNKEKIRYILNSDEKITSSD